MTEIQKFQSKLFRYQGQKSLVLQLNGTERCLIFDKFKVVSVGNTQFEIQNYVHGNIRLSYKEVYSYCFCEFTPLSAEEE